MSALFSLIAEKYHPPAVPQKGFAGKTVLITGGSSGLGLEAAKQLAALDAWTIIITARDQAKGEKAKAEIEYTCRESVTDELDIQVWPVDLSDFSSIKFFADRVNKELPRLDVAILNAGQINAAWSKVSNANGAWEMTLMVNTIGTLFLALLLLPKLLLTAKTARKDFDTDSIDLPHLEVISSIVAHTPKLAKYTTYIDDGNMLEALSQKGKFENGMQQYSLSKLFLEYGMRRIAALPAVVRGPGEPAVIINSTCPGLCQSEIGRSMAASSLTMKFALWLERLIFARPAHHGSRSYVSGVSQGPESHGRMWKNDTYRE
jgi:NAD(P)-dependent dehydrogenase (short-subunit alcohol dehydrogenase family)